MPLRLLFQDPSIIVVDKPAGFHVHPPEDPHHRVPDARNCLKLLRDQMDRYLYPVHRLDVATSGVLVLACTAEAAADVQRQFHSGTLRKTYVALVRGWPAPEGLLDAPLVNADTGQPQPAQTRYRVLHRAELDVPSPPHASSRLALVAAEPVTGRRHQVRRHFQGAGHPLLGDPEHGDKVRNRQFKEWVGHNQLMLKAYAVELTSPATGALVKVRTRWDHAWHRAFDVLGACPCHPGVEPRPAPPDVPRAHPWQHAPVPGGPS